ncbi:MAG: hypothetical protein N2202_04355 [Proteobacteria bacterium]|nr:hypothetical protein [Pseudomonadota bacterium]
MLKKFLIIIIFVLVATIFIYFLNFYLKKNIKNTNLYGKVVSKTNNINSQFVKIERDRANWKRNPFSHKNNERTGIIQTTVLEEEININVEAIVTGHKNYAIVNGKIIRVGDKIGGYKVESIQKHKIIFSKNGNKKEVYIY